MTANIIVLVLTCVALVLCIKNLWFLYFVLLPKSREMQRRGLEIEAKFQKYLDSHPH